MFRRLSIIALLFAGLIVIDLPEADAARRGGLFRRAKSTRTYRTNNNRWQNNSSRTRSTKLHETHSRSAILDGFFGPYPGGSGHDRSWYVGK